MGLLRKSRVRREGLSILHGYRNTIRGEKSTKHVQRT